MVEGGASCEAGTGGNAFARLYSATEYKGSLWVVELERINEADWSRTGCQVLDEVTVYQEYEGQTKITQAGKGAVSRQPFVPSGHTSFTDEFQILF